MGWADVCSRADNSSQMPVGRWIESVRDGGKVRVG